MSDDTTDEHDAPAAALPAQTKDTGRLMHEVEIIDGKRPALPFFIRALIPALIATAAACFYLYFLAPALSGERRGMTVVPGEDYYVTVSLLEVTPHDKEGEPWDDLSSTGPDLFVEIWWQGTMVYRSRTKEDSLLARWSDTELSLRDMALGGKSASEDDLVAGARINVQPRSEVVIRVFDEDPFGTTEIGELKLPVESLQIGEQTVTQQAAGIRRIIVKVVPMQEPAS